MKTKKKQKKVYAVANKARQPGASDVEARMVTVPAIKLLGLVHNNMSGVADKQAGLEMLAELLSTLTQAEVDYFVLHICPKLPGYSVQDALHILDNLTKFRKKFFVDKDEDTGFGRY